MKKKLNEKNKIKLKIFKEINNKYINKIFKK